MATLRTLVVELCATGGQHAVRGARLSLARGARQACPAHMPAGPQKRHTDSGELLGGRLGVGLDPAGARGALPPNDHGPVPVSLATGKRDKTLEKRARCGRVAGESVQPPGGGVAPWDLARCVDAGAAYAASGGRQLGAAGSRACGHVVAHLGQAPRRTGTDHDRRLVLEGGHLGGMLEGVDGTAAPEDITTAASHSARHTLSLRCKPTRR